MNKTEFVSAVAIEMGCTQAEASKAVNAFVNVVKNALSEGGEVKIIGFGSFSVREFAAKVVRNPQNKLKINVPAGKKPKFSAGKDLKEAVNS